MHDISLEIDDAPEAFLNINRPLNDRITALNDAHDDCRIYYINALNLNLTPTTSALQQEINGIRCTPARLCPT